MFYHSYLARDSKELFALFPHSPSILFRGQILLGSNMLLGGTHFHQLWSQIL